MYVVVNEYRVVHEMSAEWCTSGARVRSGARVGSVAQERVVHEIGAREYVVVQEITEWCTSMSGARVTRTRLVHDSAREVHEWCTRFVHDSAREVHEIT